VAIGKELTSPLSAGVTLLQGDLQGIVRAQRLWAAAIALSSVSVIANALRLRATNL
jgi:cation transport ATPase